MSEPTLLLCIALAFGALGALGRVSLSKENDVVSQHTVGSAIMGTVTASMVWAIVSTLEAKTIPIPLIDMKILVHLTPSIAAGVGGFSGAFTDVILVKIRCWFKDRSGTKAYLDRGIDRRNRDENGD